MTKVFVGGSRHTTRLNSQIRKRLDNIVEKEFPVVIGDANGADKALQRYLHDKNYHNVEVFCSGPVCRNNIGGWNMRTINVATRERNAQFYSEKDRAMAQEATVGLMLWDRKSVGTLLNVFRLLRQEKMVLIYVVPAKQFVELKNIREWESFTSGFDFHLRQKVEQRLKLEFSVKNRLNQPSFFDQDSRAV